MKENRKKQLDYSIINDEMHDRHGREKKAATMVAVLEDFYGPSIESLLVLDIGASTGIIDNYLAGYFGRVLGIDIDDAAIRSAQKKFRRENLEFQIADAQDTGFAEGEVDIIICSQVYEHVPDPEEMFAEIYRVLKPGGVCYFAASNRLMFNEPHYDLPLLSVLPRPLSHWYVRILGKGTHYHELHYTYWGLRRLVNRFKINDYTGKILSDPKKYRADYMLPEKSKKRSIARIIFKRARWLMPGYIWLLEKPRLKD